MSWTYVSTSNGVFPFHNSQQETGTRPLWSNSVWDGVSVGKNARNIELESPEQVVNRRPVGRTIHVRLVRYDTVTGIGS